MESSCKQEPDEPDMASEAQGASSSCPIVIDDDDDDCFIVDSIEQPSGEPTESYSVTTGTWNSYVSTESLSMNTSVMINNVPTESFTVHRSMTVIHVSTESISVHGSMAATGEPTESYSVATSSWNSYVSTESYGINAGLVDIDASTESYNTNGSLANEVFTESDGINAGLVDIDASTESYNTNGSLANEVPTESVTLNRDLENNYVFTESDGINAGLVHIDASTESYNTNGSLANEGEFYEEVFTESDGINAGLVDIDASTESYSTNGSSGNDGLSFRPCMMDDTELSLTDLLDTDDDVGMKPSSTDDDDSSVKAIFGEDGELNITDLLDTDDDAIEVGPPEGSPDAIEVGPQEGSPDAIEVGAQEGSPDTLALRARKRETGPTSYADAWTRRLVSRLGALNGRENVQSGATLTAEKLQQHNGSAYESTVVGADDAVDRLGIAETESNHTAESDSTLDSVMTTNRLLRKFDPTSELHKKMLAMYNASTEIIQSKGGQQTDTEYFAVLMTTLETVDTDLSRTSAAALLAIFAKRVPAAVLRKKFSCITKMCINLMQSYGQSTHVVLLRNLLGLLTSCLKALDLATWSESSTLQVFSFMFPYIIHSRPKLRKLAQRLICSILMNSSIMLAPDAPPTHPAIPAIVSFCLPVIKSSSAATSLPVSALHIFGFLKLVLRLFPQAEVKSTCEAILQVMGAGHPVVVQSGLAMLKSFFVSRPHPAATLSPELNAQLVNALYDFKPSVQDHDLYSVWLFTAKEALENLQRLSDELFLNNFPKFVGVVVESWLSGRTQIACSASTVIVRLLEKSFQACLDKEAEQSSLSRLCHAVGAIVVEHMQRALHYQFASARDQVLLTWATCFEILGKKWAPYMLQPLSDIAELYESRTYSEKTVVDRVIAAAIEAMGPELVLKAIPLDINEDEHHDFKRSWMLPLLRDNIRSTRLSFFTTYFLPLASAFHELGEASDKPASLTKAYEILERQIWSLLPGFCTSPTDFNESFPRIARTLGTYLANRSDLRLDIMSALRRLIRSNILNADCVPEMSRYAKNFLPILFNIYTNELQSRCEEGIRLAAYDTIKEFVQIADDQLCATLFFTASVQLVDDNITSHSKHAILDLARSLVCKMGHENVERLYMLAKANIEDSDRRVQKKAYRVIEEIFRCPTTVCKEFIESHLEELGEVFLDSLPSLSPGSRAPRLRCLVSLLANLSVEHKSFAWKALHEAVPSTKVNASKVEEAAYEVVTSVGEALIRWQQNDPGAAIKELVCQLSVGLTGSAHLISCTILSLSKALYKFNDVCSSVERDAVIKAVEILMASRNREIVQACLDFVLMLFVILTPLELKQHLSELVPKLCSMTEDCKKHFRKKLKNILTKLIRKFGYENIFGLLPESYQKLAVKIRKDENRKKRKKDEKIREHQSKDKHEHNGASTSGILRPSTASEGIEQILLDSSEDESDDGDENVPASTQSKKTASAWIEEQGEDDIVDFLDKSAGKHILSTDPKGPPKKKGKCPFEMTKDGRLLILDPEAEKAENDEPSSEAEEAANDLLEVLTHHKKRKRNPSSNADGEGSSGAGRGAGPSKMKKTKTSDGDPRKGKFEPYAYLPLDRKQLNKRSKKSPKGFDRLLSAAQKGSRKGQKARASSVKKTK